MSATGFEFQLNSEAEKNAFQTLELRTRMAESGSDISRVFEKYLNENPESEKFSWIASLKSSLISYAETKDEEGHLSVKDYLQSVVRKYIGNVMLFGQQEPIGLSQFSKEELLEPHMQWIKEVDKKYHEYRKAFPDMRSGSCFVMARHSSLGELSNQEVYDLFNQFTDPDEDYFVGMDFSDWVNWYISSRAKFDDEGKLLPEDASRMFKTLTAWKDYSLEDNISFLHRNFEIHPMHEERTVPWIIESREIIAQKASEQVLDSPEVK